MIVIKLGRNDCELEVSLQRTGKAVLLKEGESWTRQAQRQAKLLLSLVAMLALAGEQALLSSFCVQVATVKSWLHLWQRL